MSRDPAPVGASDHAVLELMRARRDEGSQPGARTDGARLGLAVEGGGMRGIVTCAMLTAVEDHGFTPTFDAIYGGSSGSLNAAYFLSGDLWQRMSIYYDDLASSRFIDFRRILRGHPLLDVDWALQTILDGTKPLDYAAVLASRIPLHVSISLVDSVRAVAPADFTSPADLRSALRAGAWLPLATHGTAEFRGERALDGGALVSHPSRIAVQDGCTHVLSLSSRALEPRGRDLLQWYAARHLDRLRPGFGAAFREADRVGRSDRAILRRWRTAPASAPSVLDIGPDPRSEISRQEIRSERLHAAARAAYEMTVHALTGTFRRAFPRLTTFM